MAQVNMREARTQLSRLVAYREGAGRRVPGRWKGRIVIHEAFDDPLPEEIAAPFRGVA